MSINPLACNFLTAYYPTVEFNPGMGNPWVCFRRSTGTGFGPFYGYELGLDNPFLPALLTALFCHLLLLLSVTLFYYC
jgi:hypothetical protein